MVSFLFLLGCLMLAWAILGWSQEKRGRLVLKAALLCACAGLVLAWFEARSAVIEFSDALVVSMPRGFGQQEAALLPVGSVVLVGDESLKLGDGWELVELVPGKELALGSAEPPHFARHLLLVDEAPEFGRVSIWVKRK